MEWAWGWYEDMPNAEQASCQVDEMHALGRVLQVRGLNELPMSSKIH
jgi:hypothetical protein